MMENQIKYFESFLKKHRNFILTTHEFPDGDGLGCEVALNSMLIRLGYNSVVINSDEVPIMYDFLNVDEDLNTIDEMPYDIAKMDDIGLIIVDAVGFDRIGRVQKSLEGKVNDIFIIDHHINEPAIIEKNLINTEVVCTGEIVYDLFNYFELDISFKEAQAIYTSIVLDSGSFKYERTSSKTHNIAAEMIKKGVDTSYVYTKLFENFSIGRLMLEGRILSSIEFHLDKKIAVTHFSKSMLKDVNVEYEETEDLATVTLKSKEVLLSIFIKEYDAEIIKVSLRSKSPINVRDIAKEFNGGGHKRAAGIKFFGTINECMKQIIPFAIKIVEKQLATK